MIDLYSMPEANIWAIVAAIVAILSFMLTLTVTLRSGSKEALSGYVKASLDAFRLKLDEDLKERDKAFAKTFENRDEKIGLMFQERDNRLDRTFARADLTDMRFKHIEHRLTRTADQLTVLLEAELGRQKNLSSEIARIKERMEGATERGEDPER